MSQIKLSEKLTGVSPQDRLIQLQDLYNGMELQYDTLENRFKCNCYMDEINEILKLYPELASTIQLKTYY
jgi:hypothetical protein